MEERLRPVESELADQRVQMSAALRNSDFNSDSDSSPNEALFLCRLNRMLRSFLEAGGHTAAALLHCLRSDAVDLLAASQDAVDRHRKREDADNTRDEAQKRRNEAEKRRLAETGSMPHTTHCETLGLVRTLTQTRSHCSCEVYASQVGIRHLDEILSDGENSLHRSG